jgi:hypothetical protein
MAARDVLKPTELRACGGLVAKSPNAPDNSFNDNLYLK